MAKKDGQRLPFIVLRNKIASSDTFESLYCFSHHDFVLASGTDTEHLIPMKQIVYRQKALLSYLNNNKEIAEGFMSVPGIAQYFGKKNNEILGKTRFFNAYYRQLSNLWLMCHACNLKKGSSSGVYAEQGDEALLEWFNQHSFFGEKFTSYLNKKGQIRNGILFNMLHANNTSVIKTKSIDINFSKKEYQTVRRQVDLLLAPQSQMTSTCGIATFMRHWLENNYKETLDLEKFFETTLKKHFKEKLVSSYDMEEGKAKTYYTKLYKRLFQSLSVFDETSDASSEADDEPIEKWRKDLTVIAVNNVIQMVHLLKIINKKIKAVPNSADYLIIDKLIENEDITLLMNSLTEEGWSGVMAKIDETLNSKESVTYSDITLALIEATQSNVRFVPRSVWEAAKDDSIRYLEEKKQLEKSKNEKIDELQREKRQLQREKQQLDKSKNEKIDELQRKKRQLQREKRQLEESKNEKIDELQREKRQLQREKRQLEESKNEKIDELQREKRQLQREKRQLEESKNEKIDELQREKRQLDKSKNEEIYRLKKTILLEKNAYVPFFEPQKKEVPDSLLSTNAFPSTTPPRDASLVNSLSRAQTKQRKNAMTPIMTPIKSSDDDKRPQKPRRPAITPIHSPRVTPAPRRMSTKFFTSSGLSGDIQRAEINIKNYLKTGKKHYDNKKFAEAKHCFDLGLTAVKHLKRKMKQDSLTSTLAANEKKLHEYYQQTENAINKTPKT